jgi:hypothetical protein
VKLRQPRQPLPEILAPESDPEMVARMVVEGSRQQQDALFRHGPAAELGRVFPVSAAIRTVLSSVDRSIRYPVIL